MASPRDESASQRKALLPIKIFSPIALSTFILVTILLAFLPSPNLGDVNDEYITVFTPKKELLAAWWLIIMALSLIYCIRLAVTSPPTPLSYAPAYSYPGLTLIILCVASAFFVTKLFIPAIIAVGLAFIVGVWIWVRVDLLSYRKAGFIDWLFTDVPPKLALIAIFNVHILHTLLLALQWYTYVPKSRHGHSESPPGLALPTEDSKQDWVVFGVITLIGFIDTGIVFFHKDVVWAVGTIYLWVSVMVGASQDRAERPPQVLIPLILLSILQLVGLISSLGWHHIRERRERAIQLPSDEEDQRNSNDEQQRLVRGNRNENDRPQFSSGGEEVDHF